MSVSRRSALRAAAWTAPAVVLASAAPAFATSPLPLACVPVGLKFPGKSWGTKLKHSYVISSFNCNQKVKIDAVTFAKKENGPMSGGVFKNGSWVFHSDDSRAKLWVRAYNKGALVWEGEVKFAPAQSGGHEDDKKKRGKKK